MSDDSGRNREGGVAIPTDMVAGVLFFLLGAALLALLPGQVPVAAGEVVNGRVFPRLLILLMMACSAGLIVKDVVRRVRGLPVERKLLVPAVELRALTIFLILAGTYALCELTGLFIVGACFCCAAFLVYFRCRRWSYYAITLTGAVLIWASFRFVLGVDF